MTDVILMNIEIKLDLFKNVQTRNTFGSFDDKHCINVMYYLFIYMYFSPNCIHYFYNE